MRRQIEILLTVFFVGVIPSSRVDARTYARRGAMQKPRAFSLQTPFPCGTQVRVSCAYGPQCSRAHRRTASKTSTNEYYALDLVRTENGNGSGKPVVAVAAGTVRIAGWSRGGWAPYGKLVYIEHDFHDRKGRSFESLYAHLSQVRVRAGDRVEAGTVIGTLGGSSRGHQNAFGPHLHFALYQGARNTLGGGHAVVPEPMDVFEDLHPGSKMVACAASEPVPVASAGSEGTDAAGGLTSE